MTKPTFSQIEATAKRAGYTSRVIVELGDSDIYGWARPNQNYARDFLIIEDVGGKVLKLPADECNVRELDD